MTKSVAERDAVWNAAIDAAAHNQELSWLDGVPVAEHADRIRALRRYVDGDKK